MTARETISICDSMDTLSAAMQSKKLLLKEQISSLPDGSGLKAIVLAQLDQIALALKDIDRSTHCIVQQVRRHKNSTAA